MAISTRLRAPSLSMRLARWVFTVLRLMCSSSAISALVRPAGDGDRTSSSRSVSGSTGWAGGCAGSGVGEGGEQPGGDARGDQRVAAGGGVDRLDEQLGAGVLEQEAAGARLERAVHVLVEVEGGDDDDGERVGDVGAGELRGWPRSRRARACGCRTGTRRAAAGGRAPPPRGRRRPRRRPRCRAGRRGSSRARCGRSPGRRRRARGWSSRAALRQHCVDGPAPVGSGPASKRAAEQRGPLGHADEAVRLTVLGAGVRPSPSSRDRQAHRFALVRDVDGDPGRMAGVP